MYIYDPKPWTVLWLFVSIVQEKLPKATVSESKAAEGEKKPSPKDLGLNLYNFLDVLK